MLHKTTLLLLSTVAILDCGIFGRVDADPLAPEQSPHFALLIGNSDYSTNGSLHSLGAPCKDVTAVGNALIRIGWNASDVDILCEQKKADMVQAIDKFVARFQHSAGATAVFYFAGHGAQVNENNYLFGVNADPDLPKEAITVARDARSVLFLKDAVSIEHDITSNFGYVFEGALLIILDACRDDPLIDNLKHVPSVQSVTFPRDVGAPYGTVISYSTRKGDPARDGATHVSDYPAALAQKLRTNVSIDKILSETSSLVVRQNEKTTHEQIPWREGNFDVPPDRCFLGCDGPATDAQKPAAKSTLHQRDRPNDSLIRVRFDGGAGLMTGPLVVRGSDDTTVVREPQSAESSNRSLPAEITTVYEKIGDPSSESSLIDAKPIRFDVFWCDGDQLAQSRKVSASEVAATLATWGKKLPPVGGSYISSVRLRPLPANINAKNGYMINGNVLRFEPGDPSEAAWAKALDGAFPLPVVSQAVSERSPGYLSVFVCNNVDETLRQARVYFQIARDDQASFAYNTIRKAGATIGGLTIAPQLDKRPVQSPNQTEVRYYHPEEQGKAQNLAKILSADSGQAVEPKLMQGYEKQMKALPVIEVWIGKDTYPSVGGSAEQSGVPPQ